MTAEEFRNEIVSLYEARNPRGVLAFFTQHFKSLTTALTPQQDQDVFGVALPCARRDLRALERYPEMAEAYHSQSQRTA